MASKNIIIELCDGPATRGISTTLFNPANWDEFCFRMAALLSRMACAGKHNDVGIYCDLAMRLMRSICDGSIAPIDGRVGIVPTQDHICVARVYSDGEIWINETPAAKPWERKSPLDESASALAVDLLDHAILPERIRISDTPGNRLLAARIMDQKDPDDDFYDGIVTPTGCLSIHAGKALSFIQFNLLPE